MRQSGKLIVLEGPDGAGKSTLSVKLEEHFRSMGENVLRRSFPGDQRGTLGKLVYDIHHDKAIKQPTPTSLQALHISAHIDLIERELIPAIKCGTTVILDRFWWSTYVYGKLSGVSTDTIEALINVERSVWGTIEPTALILLDRDTPLKVQPIKTWDRLRAEYKELAIKHAAIDNVIVHRNITAPAKSTREIIDKLPVSRLTQKQKNTRKTKLPPLDRVTKRLKPKPTIVFDTYWKFASERQRMYFKRLRNEHFPWTDDEILRQHKFTNAYRACDRVSQYLISNVIYSGNNTPEEVFFRIILFKIFNKIETWEYLTDTLKEVSYKTYTFEKYDELLTDAINANERIYSAAYIMPSGKSAYGHSRKHRNNLMLLEKMLTDNLPQKLAESKTMREAYALLQSYPTLGPFLAYQFITDLNYSELTNFSEMEFVVPGPGALDGISKCFSDLGDYTEEDIIKWVCEEQHSHFERLGIEFTSLWGRQLQLIDCQNLFCEISKYSRVAHPEFSGKTGRTRIKQKYSWTGPLEKPFFPPKWGINSEVF